VAERDDEIQGIAVEVERCLRCGQAHTLGFVPASTRGPGRLRGGETHEAVCPERGWKLYARIEREPLQGPTFRLVVRDFM
jgi:hypothetical protein